MNEMTSLDQAVRQYQDTVDRIEPRRSEWTKRLKPLIEKTLSGIVESHPIGWRIERSDAIENLESIFLAFPIAPSGIVRKTDSGFESSMRHGGSLGFFQTDDGTVIIQVGHPYLDGVETEPDKKPVADLEPSDIRENDITEYVKIFLQSLIQYAAQNENRITEIGFHTLLRE